MSIKHDVFVRAKTSDERWASVNAADLDERSFRSLVLDRMAEAGMFCAVQVDAARTLRTPLTKQQADDRLSSDLPSNNGEPK